MARPAIPTAFDVSPQYFYLLTLADDTVLGQIRSVQPSSSIENTRVSRVGSSTKTTLRKTKESTLALSVWPDNDLDEVARLLGATATPTTGTEVKLAADATAQNLQLKKYDAEALSATELEVHLLSNFLALELSLPVDAEGEPVLAMSGNIDDWVITKS